MMKKLVEFPLIYLLWIYLNSIHFLNVITNSESYAFFSSNLILSESNQILQGSVIRVRFDEPYNLR